MQINIKYVNISTQKKGINIKNIEISKSTYKGLQELRFDSGVKHYESDLFLIPTKEKWLTEPQLLKILKATDGPLFYNKLYTIYYLIDNKDIINIPELVLPDKVAIYNNDVIGFTMKYINNINFSVMLKNSKISHEDKIKMFDEIGNILEKMKCLRDHHIIDNFYLNDIYEGNFIYNLKTNHINVVDLDSCRIFDNKPFASRYLNPFTPSALLPYKYKVSNYVNYPNLVESDQNTDYYAYNVMLLNYLFNDTITKLDIGEFYVYLDYLRCLGYRYDILDVFYKMYTSSDNESIYYYLEELPKDLKTLTLSRKKFFESKLN